MLWAPNKESINQGGIYSVKTEQGQKSPVPQQESGFLLFRIFYTLVGVELISINYRIKNSHFRQ